VTDVALTDGLGQPAPNTADSNPIRASKPWLPLVLLLIALGYYSCYALSGLDLGGEGGTTAVYAQRLLEGQRPFVDTFLGYNLLWFYPFVWLFHWFGPNFTIVRLFFFGLSICTSLIAYRTVIRATHSPLLAFVSGLVLVLIPGIQFRNYLGLLGVGNLWLLLEAFAFPHHRRKWRLIWIVAAAFGIAFTFLIRIDLGYFFSAAVLISAIAYLVLGTERLYQRFSYTLLTIIVLPAAFIAVHLPVSFYAEQRGFERAFWDNYVSEWELIEGKAINLLPVHQSGPAQPPRQQAGSFGREALPMANNPAPQPAADRSTRRLPRWTEMFTNKFGKNRILVFLLYYPILTVPILGVAALALAVSGITKNNAGEKTEALTLIVGLASALTLFPQYFFFRPDPQHLSEMMCPYLVVSACSVAIAGRRWHSPHQAILWIARLWIVIVALHLWFYLTYGLAVPWMGSIARKKPDEKLFKAANGVIAYLPKDQQPEYENLYKAVIQHSAPNDWVICYPYAPTINFMTNRRSYFYNLYIDNATRPASFDRDAIAEIQEKRPAVILIDDEPINATESSRFSVWAAPTLAYIRAHYRYIGTYVRNEVYVAKDE
jgi:hypothetical protein